MILYQITDPDSRRVAETAKTMGYGVAHYWMDRPLPEGRVEGVFGSIEWTQHVMLRYGVDWPPVFNATHPVIKRVFGGLWRRNVEVKRGMLVSRGEFVKPMTLKEFTGHIYTGRCPQCVEYPTGIHCDVCKGTQRFELNYYQGYEVSEPVEFVNEYRLFYSRDGGSRAAKYPVEDECEFVDAFEVWPDLRSACDEFLQSVPGFVVDFGMCADGQWRIVEVGDAWAHGTYGAEVEYIKAHVARWAQLRS
jgi:hypothetical protein